MVMNHNVQAKLNNALFQRKKIGNIDKEAIFSYRICSWEWLFVVSEYFREQMIMQKDT